MAEPHGETVTELPRNEPSNGAEVYLHSFSSFLWFKGRSPPGCWWAAACEPAASQYPRVSALPLTRSHHWLVHLTRTMRMSVVSEAGFVDVPTAGVSGGAPRHLAERLTLAALTGPCGWKTASGVSPCGHQWRAERNTNHSPRSNTHKQTVHMTTPVPSSTTRTPIRLFLNSQLLSQVRPLPTNSCKKGLPFSRLKSQLGCSGGGSLCCDTPRSSGARLEPAAPVKRSSICVSSEFPLGRHFCFLRKPQHHDGTGYCIPPPSAVTCWSCTAGDAAGLSARSRSLTHRPSASLYWGQVGSQVHFNVSIMSV